MTGVEEEEWRPVIGWEGYYEVSSFGRVRSLARVVLCRDGRPLTIKAKILAGSVGNHGYPEVGLCRPGIAGRKWLVHRLVCAAFHGEPVGNVEVAHKDGCRLNARAENLRWATRKENEADKVLHRRSNRGERHGRSVLSDDLAAWVRSSPHQILDRQLALILNVTRSTVSSIRSGRTYKHLPVEGLHGDALSRLFAKNGWINGSPQ